MKDIENELEKSYEFMGDGEVSTDELIAWDNAKTYMEEKKTLELEVTGVVNKGVVADLEGLRAFIPASKLSLSRVDDLNEYLGKTVRVRVVTPAASAPRVISAPVPVAVITVAELLYSLTMRNSQMVCCLLPHRWQVTDTSDLRTA